MGAMHLMPARGGERGACQGHGHRCHGDTFPLLHLPASPHPPSPLALSSTSHPREPTMAAADSTSLEGALLGMGNPLLDISAEVGQDILDK